ncbi:TNFR13C [Arapaima gigas]
MVEQTDKGMKKSCDHGLVWDKLVNDCTPLLQDKTLQVTDALLTSTWSTKVPCPQPSVVSVSVWISVASVTSIAVVALLLWLAIYRRERRPFQHTENMTAEQPFNRQGAEDQAVVLVVDDEEKEAPTSFLHQNGGPLGDQEQEPPTWSGVVVCQAGAHMCNGRKKHGVPLPATELGDAALVTTKTVQCSD